MFFGRRKHAAPARVEVPTGAAPTASAPAASQPATPELTDEMIFAAVQRTMQAVFGDDGEWTVARRSADQTDQIFHEVLVHSLATAVTASVVSARGGRAAGASQTGVAVVDAAVLDDGAFDDVMAGGPLGLLRAPRANPWLSAPATDQPDSAVEASHEADDEAVAFSWEPAPITRWADLKRPVTGPVAILDAAAAAGEEKAA